MFEVGHINSVALIGCVYFAKVGSAYKNYIF